STGKLFLFFVVPATISVFVFMLIFGIPLSKKIILSENESISLKIRRHPSFCKKSQHFGVCLRDRVAGVIFKKDREAIEFDLSDSIFLLSRKHEVDSGLWVNLSMVN